MYSSQTSPRRLQQSTEDQSVCVPEKKFHRQIQIKFAFWRKIIWNVCQAKWEWRHKAKKYELKSMPDGDRLNRENILRGSDLFASWFIPGEEKKQ